MLHSSHVYAKWDPIFTFTINGASGYSGMCAFFFNEFVGFVAGAENPGIFKTTDGGKTWVQCTITTGGPFNFNITQIFMKDSLRGWATIEEGGINYRAVIRTSDGGLHWTNTGLNGDYSCVYETPSAIVLTTRSNYGLGQISTDGGATFTRMAPLDTMNGLDFVDDLNGVATGFYSRLWKRSNDGGRTWLTISPPEQVESWSVYGQKGTSNFFACPEKDHRFPVNRVASTVYRSTDYGATWAGVYMLPVTSTGTIRGAAGVLYVQADTNSSINTIPNNRGFYRSTDGGFSWKNIGGPANGKDLRFEVTGCSGGVVYAFDKDGNVWKTRDGGDGSIQEPPIELQIDKNSIQFAGPICSTSMATLQLLNMYCTDDTLLSVTIVNPSSDLFTSGALTLVSQPNLPLALTSGKPEDIVFKWDPIKLFHRDTTITTQLRLKYYSKILGRALDTVITVSAHAIGQSPSATLNPSSFSFGALKFCKTYDTSITIKNTGCDTLFIYDTASLVKFGYRLTGTNGAPLSLPIVLLPNDTFSFKLELSLTVAGSYTNALTFRLLHQGIKRDTSFSFNATMSSAGSFAISDSLFVGSVSTCSELDTTVIIKNLSCVPLVILNTALQKGTEFSLTGVPIFTSPVAPGDSERIAVRFKPSANGLFKDKLFLNIVSLGESNALAIPLAGRGFSSTALLQGSMPFDTLFDLHLTHCDSPVVFKNIISNPGCSTLTILSVDANPPLSTDITLSGGSLPANIVSGISDTLVMRVAPRDTGTFNGTITISFVLNGQRRDTTMQYFLRVDYGLRALQISADTIVFDSMKFCDTRDTSILLKSLGCDSLDITSVQIHGEGNFTITDQPKLKLLMNDTTSVAFHFEPTTTGSINGTLTIEADGEPNIIKQIPIKAYVIPTDTLVFDVSATRPDISAGDTISFFVMPRQAVHNKRLNDVVFSVNYNGDLLTFLPGKSKPLIQQAVFTSLPVTGTPKHSKAEIKLIGLPTLEFDSGVPVMVLVFTAALTDSITTTMSLSDVIINDGEPNYSKCTLGIISSDIGYSISLHCGDATIVKYMQLGEEFTLRAAPVVPDPLSTNSSWRGYLPFVANLTGDVRLDIFDQIGRPVANDLLQIRTKGEYHFTIDGNKLSSGLYSYILRHLANGASVTGRFSIIR